MRLALIATGGTIAGSGSQQHYSAGVLSAETLFAAAPRLAELADWHIEQPFALDSRDLTPEHWLLLASTIQTQLDAPDIAGVVLTHGTDTLEETAFALHWLLPTGKPVVLTAAMRPASSLSPDGPQNLLQAACVALSPQARNQGVLVVANDAVIAARHVTKAHTHAPGALQSRAGLLGSIAGEQPLLPPAPCPPRPALLPIPARTALPRVDILHAHAGASPDLLDACVAAGAAGIVLALAGHGSIPAVWRPAIARARSHGCHILRASLIPQGGVWPQSNEDDAATGCVAAGPCSAVQARALLLLILANQPGIERDALARLFAQTL